MLGFELFLRLDVSQWDAVINDLILIITLIASLGIELDSLSEEDLKEINNKILSCSKDLSFIMLND